MKREFFLSTRFWHSVLVLKLYKLFVDNTSNVQSNTVILPH